MLRSRLVSFRWKLFIAYICLLIPALLVFYIWTERWLRSTYLEVVRDQLEREVRMLATVLDLDSPTLDEQVDKTVEGVGRRLTVIAVDGRVIADSSFSGVDLEAMDNHASRPEIVAANRQGVGSSLRFSNSVQQPFLYVAWTIPEQSVSIRVSTSVEGIEEAAAELRRALGGHTLVLILLGLPLAFLLSRHFSRPLGELDAAAGRIAAGDFSQPVQVRGTDEISHLGQTLQSMALQIEGQMLDLESERNHLRRAELARKDFVGNVSHELRTPLTSITGYSETLLQSGELSEIQMKFLEKIYLNSVQLKEIVNDLLELSRLEGKDLELSYTAVSVEALEKELRSTLEAPLAEKEIDLVFRNDSGKASLRAPEIHLRRILLNLLDNAVKYTQKGQVEVLLESRDGELRVSVRDTGMGIAEQDVDRVFERFYRGAQARSESIPGTGLGLSIVKHVVELLGGRIWLESKLREGTTVSFTIPQ